ncbi:MAG: siphovirus Gp157 family protein [Desulfitobacteriaceae bacterium]
MSIKLYELTNDFNAIFELIDSEDFDLSVLEDTLQAVEGNIEVKVEGTIRMLKNWEAQAAAMEAEEKRLKDSRKALENRIDHIKDYVLQNMELMGKDKIPTSIGNVCRQKNPPSIDVVDMRVIPETYIYIPPVEPKVDKKAIMERFKATGEMVLGTRLVQGFHLRIR